MPPILACVTVLRRIAPRRVDHHRVFGKPPIAIPRTAPKPCKPPCWPDGERSRCSPAPWFPRWWPDDHIPRHVIEIRLWCPGFLFKVPKAAVIRLANSRPSPAGASTTIAFSKATLPLRRRKNAISPQTTNTKANKPMIGARTHSGSNGCASPKPISGPANQTGEETPETRSEPAQV